MGRVFSDWTGHNRSSRLGILLAIVLGMSLGLSSTVAFASGEAHPFLFSFGSFSNPNGIAVDEANGDVYVADIGTSTIYKFDAAGKPASFSALGSNELTGGATPAKSFSFPNAAGTAAAIAIDQSASPFDPSAGDLYVMDAGHAVIDKFSPSGGYIGQIPESFADDELLGLSVDAKGDVRVEWMHPERNARAVVDVFDGSTRNVLIKSLTARANWTEGAVRGMPGHGFATNSTGGEYQLYACGCVEMFDGNEEGLGRVDNGPSDIAFAVDPASGHLYVDDRSSVNEWDTGQMNGRAPLAGSVEDMPTASLVSSFGASQLSGTPTEGGIAVNGTSGDIYVSNPVDGKVYVFGESVPAASAGTAAGVTKTSATLTGTVDPRGLPVTSCKFEYESASPSSLEVMVPPSVMGRSVPCEQTPGQIGSGTGSVSVTANVSSLQSGLLYYFRLVVSNANGADPSGGMFATSGPGFGAKVFEVSFVNSDGTPDTQAGSHPYEMKTNIALNTAVLRRAPAAAVSPYVVLPDGEVKDIITDLPPGLVGDPDATIAKCTLAELESVGDSGENNCPLESVVGQLEVEFGAQGTGTQTPINEPVYNMVAPHGVAVQIGANFIIPKAFINAGVQAGGDYPVQATSLNIPPVEPIVATRLTIFGVVGSGSDRKAFLTLPTGCTGPLRSTLAIDSYQAPGHFVEATSLSRDAAGEPVALTGCSRLQFPPTISVAPDTTDASTASGLTVGVHVSQKAASNPGGLAESALRDTTVTLPEGVALNPAGADGLEACGEGLAGFTGFSEFNAESEPGVQTSTFTPEMPSPTLPGINFCPNGSKIGTVQIKTPLLPDPLAGAVYLGSQNANPFGSLVAMYMIVEDPMSGSLIKLTGEVKLTATGQIVTTFKNTPDLPFEDLELHFFGGERAPLRTPSRCGIYTTTAVFTPWDGNGPVTSTSSFKIDHGPGGAPCPGASLPFNPSLTAGTTSNQAGGFTPFTMTMSREDGQQNMQAITLKMPPGLSGLLTGVELCGEAQANAGTCGENSLIGETIVSVGVGNDPFSVKGGKVYLTGPYKGAPFGLSIVNPAKAGPFDLENTPANHPACDCLVVRAKIEVDPTTADLTVTSDNEGPYKIPTMIEGIPLQIKHMNVTINRPGFTFNPTDCNPMSITGDLHSTEGGSDAISVPFQATNCARLSFKPSFQVSTSGRTSRLEGASLHVKLTYPKLPFGSQANIGSVKVDLPRQLPSNLEALKHACIDTTFNANPAACPAESRVGNAMATTPLIPVPLSGPAYFVSHGGAKFPELIVVLQGYGVTVDLHGETFISKAGITSSTFHTIPDVPVGTFELNLPERPKFAALAAPESLCKITKTVLVKHKVRVRSKNGTSHTITRKVKKTVAAGMVMPTAFTAQNGAVIHQNTPIEVIGCGAKHKARNKTKASKRSHGNRK